MLRTWATGDVRPWATRAWTQQGFTLLELTVVLAIIVLTTAAIPLALNRMVPKLRLTKAAQQVASIIREAETQSLIRHRAVQLVINDRSISADASLRAEGREAALVVMIPEEVQFNATGLSGQPLNSLTVYPDGATTGGSLVLMDSARRALVAVSPLTGRVTMEMGT